MGVGGVMQIGATERERPAFGGTEFDAIGPYERLHGTIFGELDPTHAPAQRIAVTDSLRIDKLASRGR